MRLIKLYLLMIIIGSSLSVMAGKPIREKICLNDSSWRFIRQEVPSSETTTFNDASWMKVKIPHDWNGGVDGVHNDVFTGPDMYLGPGSYRVTFFVSSIYQGKELSIQFEAVSLVADVWLNGTYLGKHKGGYTSFSYNISHLLNYGSENVVTVKASNANDPTVAPWMLEPFGAFPRSSDYAVYGGIYRDVWLLITDKVNLKTESHTTSLVSATSACINVKTSVSNNRNSSVELILKTFVTDSMGKVVKSSEKPVFLKANFDSAIEQQVVMENPRLWSPENPYIYKVHSVISEKGKEIDTMANTLGIRWYRLKNGMGFMLNGQHVFLHGVNRHQDREGFGYALSNEQHVQDMKMIKSLGFNFMRHAHYPCDESVLDACDKLGLMVWLEIPVSTCISPNPAFLENAKCQLTEMIKEHSNHPCIIVWGIGNESDQSGASTEAYSNAFLRELNTLAHANDSTRPTTGCNYILKSDQQIPDVYAPQDWTGWYVGEYAGDYYGYNPTKMIGEYGADAYIPSHDETFVSTAKNKPWTQESACRLHEYKVSKGESVGNQFPGQLTWVAFDFASPRKDRVGNPIPYMNQKGLITHDHTTLKDVAYFYRSFYTKGQDNPMVYIVSHSWKDRITKPGKYTIWIYSNCDSVALFNGFQKISLGTKTRRRGPRPDNPTRFEWIEASISSANLYAEGYVNGKTAAKDNLDFENFTQVVLNEK